MKNVKALLKKYDGKINEKFREGFLELRNTPRQGGKAPAEIVFGHPLRTQVPIHHKAFDSKWLMSMDEHDARSAKRDLQILKRYNKSAKDLPELSPGMQTAVQDPLTKLWDKSGTVMSKGSNRNYRIKFPSGRCLWRNRRFLKPLPTKRGKKEDEDMELHNGQDNGATARKDKEQDGTPRRSKRVRFKTQRFDFNDH